MPHSAIVLKPGVNTTETPTLNEAGVSSCQLIRYFYDQNYGGLVQKLGGWYKWISQTQTNGTIRALWAWEDIESHAHLAVGTQDAANTYTANLSVVTPPAQAGVDITPQSFIDNIAPVVNTTSGQSRVTITDATSGEITNYDTVYITTQISVGGLILFGLYPCNTDGVISPTQYTIVATDVLGNPLPASATSSSTSLPVFATTVGSITVQVTMTGHGLSVGSTFPVLTPTQVGGVTFTGNYIVQTIVDANNFTILAANPATSTTTGTLNNGNAQFIYSIGAGAIPGGTGFGIGGFGTGGFGVGSGITPAVGTDISAVNWSLDNWGEILISCPVQPTITLTPTAASGDSTTVTITFAENYTVPVGTSIVVAGMVPTGYNGFWYVSASSAGSLSFLSATTGAMTTAGTITVNVPQFSPIYAWSPESGVPIAQALPYGPPVNNGCFVAMPQRQIVAWGSTFNGIPDPLLVRWCDVSNFNVWIGQIVNQAGSYRLTKGSRIVGAIQGPQQGLIWTDVDLWAMQYIGPPYVYSFNEIGTGCGLISMNAAASFNGIVYWMGPNQLFTLSGDGVRPLPCPVWDVVYQQLDQTQVSLIRVAVNSRFGEVSWHFPTINGTTMYVKYNAFLQVWDYGTLTRTAWVDQSVLGPPIGAGPDSQTMAQYLYQHDGTNPMTGLPATDDDVYPMVSSFTTGYASIAEADLKTFVDQLWPDMKWNYFGQTATSGNVQITFSFTDYPNQAPQTVGPYTMNSSTQFLSPRFRGRLVSATIGSSDSGSFWRVGKLRYRSSPDGKF